MLRDQGSPRVIRGGRSGSQDPQTTSPTEASAPNRARPEMQAKIPEMTERYPTLSCLRTSARLRLVGVGVSPSAVPYVRGHGLTEQEGVTRLRLLGESALSLDVGSMNLRYQGDVNNETLK